MATSKPIADYAIIGDTHSSALVASDGRIDWLCWPRHDSPALFTRLLDEADGGGMAVEFDGGLAAAGRSYQDQTAILRTRFAGAGAGADLIDLMPVHPPSTERDSGPDGDASGRIVRLLTATKGHVSGRFRVSLTPDYGRREAVLDLAEGRCVARCGELTIEISGSGPVGVEDGAIVMPFAVAERDTAWIALSLLGDDDVAPLREHGEAQRDLAETGRYWRKWSGAIRYDGAYRDAVVRSAITLKLLTYSPTGAIVAAATASLPEAVPGNRNYDYRFSWVRDASFTVTAFCNLGLVREASEYLRFLLDAEGELQLLYGIEGPVPREEALAHLPGWNGTGPVRVGNAADDQTQHDIYGEFLVALHAWLEATDYETPDWIAGRLPDLICRLADHALSCRDVADHGIWELRTEPQHLQHSKALIWVALDRAQKTAERLGGFDEARLRSWRSAADQLRLEYERDTWDDGRGAYMQGYGSTVLDAAVLRTVLFGALDPADPRTLSTLSAVERELSDGDLTYRYRMDDGLEGEEATFTACAFWRVGCMALAGLTAPARAMFERLLARANDVGLFAEEIDAATGEQRGNVPQGFTHMCVINHAVRLEGAIERFGLQGAAGEAAAAA